MLAAPGFGQRLHTADYYSAIKAMLGVLRPLSSLRTIADHLNRQGFSTPTGLPFTRDRVATFIRSNPVK